VAIAFLLVPVVSAAIGFLLFPFVAIGGRPANMLDAAIAFGLAIGMASVFVIGFGAFPLLVWLLKRGSVTLSHTLVAGAALGNLPGALIVIRLLSMGHGWEEVVVGGRAWALGAFRSVLFGSAIGLVSAAVFWVMAGRQLRGELTHEA
jgi:hypothetical protein